MATPKIHGSTQPPVPPSSSPAAPDRPIPTDVLGILLKDPTSPGALARDLLYDVSLNAELKRWREEPALRDAPLPLQVVRWQQIAETYAGQLAYVEARAMATAVELTQAKLPRSRGGIGGTTWSSAEVRMALAAERVVVECELGHRPWTGTLRWYARAWRVLDQRMVLDAGANAQKKRAAVRIVSVTEARS